MEKPKSSGSEGSGKYLESNQNIPCGPSMMQLPKTNRIPPWEVFSKWTKSMVLFSRHLTSKKALKIPLISRFWQTPSAVGSWLQHHWRTAAQGTSGISSWKSKNWCIWNFLSLLTSPWKLSNPWINPKCTPIQLVIQMESSGDLPIIGLPLLLCQEFV